MPIHTGAPHDGRLNLEQQKKRAKELLKAFATGDASARERFSTHHPRATDPKLADAQFVLARENGFASWPKLVAHAEAPAARQAISGVAPDTPSTLHIRCGTDIEMTLRDAGFTGRFHEFSDPFCQGPLRDLPRNAFRAERIAFLASDYDIPEAEIRHREQEAYAVFDELQSFSEIVLWFEHDSYDQLILAFLLTELAGRTTPPIRLICADDVPAVSRFVGLGQLSPEVIRWLWSARRPVGQPEFDLGHKVWKALTNPSPQPLLAIATAGTPAIPPMAGALMRHLMELPSTTNGLGLVEQLALDIIAKNEGSELRALFQPYMAREPLPFLGDTMFAAIVTDLARAGDPALDLHPGSGPGVWYLRPSLTPTGHALLANARDWLACAPIPRWVGGIEIRPGQPNWRFDHARKTVARS